MALALMGIAPLAAILPAGAEKCGKCIRMLRML